MYIKLFEDFNLEYNSTLYNIIKKTIIKLHYDTDRDFKEVADLLLLNGLSKPIAAQVSKLLIRNKIKEPEKIDNYIDNIIQLMKYTNDKPIFKNLWGQ
jgi:hypothetical protein